MAFSYVLNNRRNFHEVEPRKHFVLYLLAFTLSICLNSFGVKAETFSSSKFKIIDPSISVGGGRSSSDSFRIDPSIGEPAVGDSSSGSFKEKGGFYPIEPPPAPAPAPSPAPSPAPAPATSPAGGGSGGIFVEAPKPTRVIMKGRAYPRASITAFKDGTVVGTPTADKDGNFEITVDVEGGFYTFSIFGIDVDNRRSLTYSFTTSVAKGFTVIISDIILSPTIGADKAEVKYGNDITFLGYAYPNSDVGVIINSEGQINATTSSDKIGRWEYAFDSKQVEKGSHTTKSQTVTRDNLRSPFSETLAFQVGDKDVSFGKISRPAGLITPFLPKKACNKNGDINDDGKVNIVDFSIMLFFWQQHNPKNPCADINQDGIVNLIDFSIMLFWWTG